MWEIKVVVDELASICGKGLSAALLSTIGLHEKEIVSCWSDSYEMRSTEYKESVLCGMQSQQ